MLKKYTAEMARLNSGQRIFLLTGILAMAAVVTASNILVEYPVNDWLTWGALSYPIAFLVTDITNRTLGVRLAREVDRGPAHRGCIRNGLFDCSVAGCDNF